MTENQTTGAAALAQSDISMADAALQAISETNNTIPDPHLHAPLAADALAPVAEGDNGFVKLGLAEPLVQACLDLGYTQPTVVQNTAIPMALAEKDAEGHNYVDLMVSSQTGSGKTAAFLLPVLHTLLEQQQDAIAAEKAEWQRKIDEAIANGEEPPKKPRLRRTNSSQSTSKFQRTKHNEITCPIVKTNQQEYPVVSRRSLKFSRIESPPSTGTHFALVIRREMRDQVVTGVLDLKRNRTLCA